MSFDLKDIRGEGWHYLYRKAGWSRVAPARSDEKCGWYNGEDECLELALMVDSDNITEFYEPRRAKENESIGQIKSEMKKGKVYGHFC